MAGLAHVHTREPPPAPIEIVCEYCGRFIAVANSPFDVPDRALHSECEGLRMLTQVVPQWPRDPLVRGEVDRLKRAFPDWDWDEAWGSGRTGTLPMSQEAV